MDFICFTVDSRDYYSWPICKLKGESAYKYLFHKEERIVFMNRR